jgi:hypothetical protein
MIDGRGSAGQSSAERTPAIASRLVFGSDAAFILNFVKADKTGDFELVIAKLKEALQTSGRPERKQQATGWRVFRASEGGPAASVIYLFVIAPPLKGADYSVANLITEAFPAEARALLLTLTDSLAQGQTSINLTLMATLRK